VLVALGRTHLYEGHGLAPVVRLVRAAGACGARTALLTNANGSLRRDWSLGQAVLVADHLNLTGTSPLEGATFVDLTDAWSPRLRDLARSLDPSLEEGVYAWLRGPHYETWAEAEWLRRVGADMLGMSTVPEAIAAREWGMEVLGLSTVTALEGPGTSPDTTTPSGIDPSDVVAIAERTAARLGPLLVELVRKGARA
jgi:purine-nucleoside phosphorylase